MKKTHQLLRTILALSLCCVLFCGAAFAGTFPDVSDSAFYATAVETLADLGILQGDSHGNFNPNNTITRAEAATIVCRMLGVESEAKTLKTSKFSDVSSNHWAVGYISKAAELGIIDGYGNGKFGPSDSVTKQQIIKMLVCAWGYEEEAKNTGGWPSGYTQLAVHLQIADNVSSIDPGSAIRSDVAIWVYNTLLVDMSVEG